jgi:8-oxo-dGTP diphosphatase
VHRRRRIGAYGVCFDQWGRLLVVRGSARSEAPGAWRIPGGEIRHGEHPEAALVREIAEQTGLTARVVGLRDARADVADLPDRGVATHHDRLVFDVAVDGGELRALSTASTDLAAWYTPEELAALPVMAFMRWVLGPGTRNVSDEHAPWGLPAEPDPRVQRFGAYGVVTDPDGRVLLSLIAEGYGGAGRWHLPGGGTDHGEQPMEGLLREIYEETGQHGRIVGVAGVSHRHNPAALGPEGYPIDWHTVRVLYKVSVDRPTTPVVTEAGGSTAKAGWFTPTELLDLPLTEPAAAALRN